MNHSNDAQPLALNKATSKQLPRNSFDMSYHSYFTSPAGMLLPNFVQDVQPGDFLNLEVSNFSRTMPVNTAAFARLKEVNDFYFVPYRLLWRWFDQLYTGVNDISTSYTPVSEIPNSVPSIVCTDIYNTLLNNNNDDIFGFANKINAERLLDLLGYPVSNDSSRTTQDLYFQMDQKNSTNKPSFNPFRLLAYQKIFNDFYRNTDYTANDPQSYNIDKFNSGTNLDLPTVKKLLTPRYVQWKRDRFTSIKPQPLTQFPYAFSGTVPKNGEGISSGFISANYANNSQVIGVSGSSGYVNISELRATMAYDRLSRLTMLTPKLYDDQLRAHFGVNPNSCDYCRPSYLGSFDSPLNIGEVTATASGSDGKSTNILGQIAGKGIVSGRTNHPIKKQFEEPGIVIGMHYFIPLAEYDSKRIDDFNIKFNRNDYYIPEYDALGLQQLRQSSLYINAEDTTSLNTLLGYQARYLEYKTRVDEVHGEFQSKKPLSSWAIPRNNIVSKNGMSTQDLYVNPKITDTLFAFGYDGTQKTDPFLCHYRFDCTLVRNMSVLGIPTL